MTIHVLECFQEHAYVAAHAREVCDDQAAVASLLDACDGFEESGALFERQTAADIQLGRQEVDCVTTRRDGAFDVGLLVGEGMESVGFGVSSSEMRDSEDGCPAHYSDATGKSTCDGPWLQYSPLPDSRPGIEQF